MDEQAIPLMYKRLSAMFNGLNVTYEIIFVNDGSPDKTETVINNIVKNDSHVIGVHHSRNFSSQMAFTSGMKIAQGKGVILLDGDLQDPPEIIPQFYARWLEGYDVVYGTRVKRETSLFMNSMYRLFYRLFHLLSYVQIPKDAGDFSLIDHRVVEILNTFPERDRFLRGLRAWVGFRQIGVPYVRPERAFGKTTNSLLKNFHWAVKGILSFSYVPLQFVTLISLATLCLSVLGIIWQIIAKFIFLGTPKGISTILIVILFLGSSQLLALSIIGEYIGKIFEEVKQRPPFIVKYISRYQNR